MALMIFTLIVAGASAGTFTALVRGKHTERHDLLGWIGASLGVVSVTMITISTIAMSGISGDVDVFLATFLSLALLTVGVVYFVKRNRKPFDDRTQRNYVPGHRTVHAWGTYSAETVAAKRRRVF